MQWKKSYFLHIGINKVGSSVIQAFLVGNEPTLNKLGDLYPQIGWVSNAHYRVSGCSDFLDAIDMTDSDAFRIPSNATNASLGNDTVFILDRIARMDLLDTAKQQLFSWFISYQLIHQTGAEQTPGKQLLLSPEQRLDLILRYEPSNRKVAESYLKRKDGRLFVPD